MSTNNTSADSWDGLISNYLKAENIQEQEDDVVCTGINVSGKDMELEVEHNRKKWLFGLNITNRKFLKENGIFKPKDVIGKLLTLKKVLANDPNKHKEVESLRICNVKNIDSL